MAPRFRGLPSSGDYRLRPMQIAQLLSDIPKRSLALLILLASLESQALTLGRIQGAALIGRPLAVSIAVQPDPGQSLSSSCFEADVFHGDTKQDASRVKLRLDPAASGQGSVLRLNSDNPVNEPVVTVYLRAGCDQKISRRYVMLADIVSEQAAPVAPRVGAVPLVMPEAAASPPRSAPSPVQTLAAATTGDAAEAPVARPNAASTRASTEPTSPAASRAAKRPSKAAATRSASPPRAAPVKPAAAPPTPSVSDEKVRAGRSAGQSRLRLDSLELLSERVATLESVTANAPAEAAAREARDAQRLDSLEASVKSLVALAAKNEASLLALRVRLEQAQAERYNNPVVYLLLALLLASLIAIAYLMSRSSQRARQEPPENWWDGSNVRPPVSAAVTGDQAAQPESPVRDRGPDSGLSAISEPSPLSQPIGLTPPERGPAQQTQPMTQGMPMRHAGAVPPQVDVSLVEMSESTFDRLMQSGTAHSGARKLRDDESTSASLQGTAAAVGEMPGAGRPRPRRIDSDELIDIRQRAEFFVTLGQTDQAVQVLEARIAQDRESCPQAFLDLLKLFHSLGLKADFMQVREEFSRIFNVSIPEFADFDEEGLELEEYPGTVDRLIAIWDRPAVLDVIEHLIYRQKGDTSHQPFDLAGFRDLLMLHSVAQMVRGGEASDADPSQQQGSAANAGASLDIDLSDGSDSSAGPEGMPSGAFPVLPPVASLSPSEAGNLIDFDLTEIPLDNNKPGGN
jgi:pilus assembly protein FimV